MAFKQFDLERQFTSWTAVIDAQVSLSSILRECIDDLRAVMIFLCSALVSTGNIVRVCLNDLAKWSILFCRERLGNDASLG